MDSCVINPISLRWNRLNNISEIVDFNVIFPLFLSHLAFSFLSRFSLCLSLSFFALLIWFDDRSKSSFLLTSLCSVKSFFSFTSFFFCKTYREHSLKPLKTSCNLYSTGLYSSRITEVSDRTCVVIWNLAQCDRELPTLHRYEQTIWTGFTV